jgi:phenylacetaldehyde dehydrogenase
VNCHTIFDAALPFGGYKQSGWGRGMGHEVVNLYTQIKSLWIRLS